MGNLTQPEANPVPVVVRVGNRHPKSPPHRRVIGSALAALAGWLALIVASLADSWLREWSFVGWDYFGVFAAVSFGMVFLVWVAFLVPLYLWVPRHSVLWRWPVCTVCGAVSGPLIPMVFAILLSFGAHYRRGFWAAIQTVKFDESGLLFLGLSALTGAVTCLVGSLTAPRFHDFSHPKNTGYKGTW